VYVHNGPCVVVVVSCILCNKIVVSPKSSFLYALLLFGLPNVHVTSPSVIMTMQNIPSRWPILVPLGCLVVVVVVVVVVQFAILPKGRRRGGGGHNVACILHVLLSSLY